MGNVHEVYQVDVYTYNGGTVTSYFLNGREFGQENELPKQRYDNFVAAVVDAFQPGDVVHNLEGAVTNDEDGKVHFKRELLDSQMRPINLGILKKINE